MAVQLTKRAFIKSTGFASLGLSLGGPSAAQAKLIKRKGPPRLNLSLAAYSFRDYFNTATHLQNRPADAKEITMQDFIDYCADQGFYLGEHGWFDKRWAYEESLKMPLIMRWPGKIKAGTRSQALVQNIDYAPTLLEVAGLKPQWSVHGTSLLPILSGEGMVPDDWRKAIYYRYMDAGHGVPRHRAVRTLGHKLIYFDQPRNAAEEENRWELFDTVSYTHLTLPTKRIV